MPEDKMGFELVTLHERGSKHSQHSILLYSDDLKANPCL